MKYCNFFIFFLLIFSACDTDTSNSNTNTDTNNEQPEVETQPATQESKWLCIPNKQVGLIKEDADEESIIEAYGKENVIRQEVGIGEGEMVAATIVFPDSPDELIVEWQDGFEYKKLSRIRIEQKGAKWETEEGIKIGTTLDELVKINGKDFNFYGFDWDYGGVANEWEDGKINSQLTVVLAPKDPNASFPELAGDGTFSSSNPKAKEARLEVIAFVIYFGV